MAGRQALHQVALPSVPHDSLQHNVVEQVDPPVVASMPGSGRRAAKESLPKRKPGRPKKLPKFQANLAMRSDTPQLKLLAKRSGKT